MRGMALMVGAAVLALPGHAAAQGKDLKSSVPEAVTGFPAPAKGPQPAGDPGSWVTPDDYPREALVKGAQGIVGFMLDVDSAGRVSTCTLTQSSGILDLDQATCALISARALFSPARDAQGGTMPGRYRSRVKWVVPTASPPPVGSVITRAIVQADGTVTECFVEITGDMALKPGAPKNGPCPATRDYSDGYVDAMGMPAARRLVITQKVEVLPIDGESSKEDAAVPGKRPVAPVTGRAP